MSDAAEVLRRGEERFLERARGEDSDLVEKLSEKGKVSHIRMVCPVCGHIRFSYTRTYEILKGDRGEYRAESFCQARCNACEKLIIEGKGDMDFRMIGECLAQAGITGEPIVEEDGGLIEDVGGGFSSYDRGRL